MKAVASQLVSDGTKATYTQENLIFVIYLYDTDADNFIWDQVLDGFHKAHEKDQEEERTKKSRRNLRECIRHHLSLMNRFDKNCPIILQKITYAVFTRYMLDIRSRGDGDDIVYLASTSYGLMKSALIYLFNSSGQEMESGLCKELDTFMRALRKSVAKAKAQSGRSLEEGKRPMSFPVYHLMCQKLFESETPDALFAHTYLVLEWNLMARAHMVGDMNVAHIEWRQDCLLFFFGKSKRNQEGEDAERPYHVYSNPQNPEICPVLALATYLVAYPEVLKESGGLLFPGSAQYSRFMKIFHKTIDEHADEFKKLGVKKGDLGSHSCRKGAITLVTTGCTVSPPMAAVCIRAGWSMGQVKDRYIHYEKAGDQFVGRTVTGIPAISSDFAISPVHWDWSGLSPSEESTLKKKLEEVTSGIADKDRVTAATFGMLQYLYAAILFHYDYLNENLGERNQLRASFGFMEAADCGLKEYAVVRFPWESTPYTPNPSGIPPHVMILNKLEGMQKQLSAFPEVIIEGICKEFQEMRQAMKEELDKRNVGGAAFGAQQAIEDLIADFRNEFDVTKAGGKYNVLDDDEEDDLFSGDFGDDRSEERERRRIESPKRTAAPSAVETGGGKRRKVAVLDWNSILGTGKNRIVLAPADYKFPFLTLSSFISSWYCGDRTNNIPPYRMLSGKDIPAMRSGRNQLSMMRKLISHVERAAIEVANRKELVIKRRAWTNKDCQALYIGVAHFFKFPSKQKRRYEQLSWKTFYNMLSKRNWQLLGEKADDSQQPAQPAAAAPLPPSHAAEASEAPPPPRAAAARARQKGGKRTGSANKRRRRIATRQSPRKQPPARQSPARKQPPTDSFGAAFANHSGNDEHLKNICAFGTKCDVRIDPVTYGGMSKKYKCKAPDCDNEIHHTCAAKNGCGEMNDACCSKECYYKIS